MNISSRKILDTLEKLREKRCVKNCAEKPSLEKRRKSTSRQNHVKVREYFKSVHEVCKKIAQNIFGKFFRVLVGDFPCERKKLLTLSKQKKRKIKGKESTSHNN